MGVCWRGNGSGIGSQDGSTGVPGGGCRGVGWGECGE